MENLHGIEGGWYHPVRSTDARSDVSIVPLVEKPSPSETMYEKSFVARHSITRKPVPTSREELDIESSSNDWRASSSEDTNVFKMSHDKSGRSIDVSQQLLNDRKQSSSPSLCQTHNGSQHEQARPNHSLRELFLQCSIHLLPILITALLLVLNGRNVYWQDADARTVQAVILQSLQFPVKAHEVLITASVAAVILHRVRYDLIKTRDLPLGFLTSPYRIGEIRYLFSHEFWGATTTRNSSNKMMSRQLSMGLLIIAGSALTLLVGPSSGILMIPKLGWYNLKHPYDSSTESLYYNATRNELWPAALTDYECGSWLCPAAGADNLAVWASNMMREHVVPQIANIGGSSFNRMLTSNSTTSTDNWTATTSLLMRDAEALGAFWNYLVEFNRAPTRLKQPRLAPQFVTGNTFLKPLVQVECLAQTYDVNASYNFPHSNLQGTQSNMYADVQWTLPHEYYNWTGQSFIPPAFGFVDVNNESIVPTVGALFRLTEFETQKEMIVPCSVLAHWIPTNIWLDPKNDFYTHDTTQNPLQAFEATSPKDRADWIEISLTDAWLNLMGTDSMAYVLQTMTNADNGTLRSGYEGLSWRLSTVLGLWLTDGIARYATNGSVLVLHEGDQGSGDESAFSDIGILEYGNTPVPPGYQSWTDFLQQKSWLQIAIAVDRYGYAWSFRGVLIKLAAAVLSIHALFALAHVFLLLQDRWTSDAWSSIGSIVALCLRSDVVKNIDGQYEPILKAKKHKLWTFPVEASLDTDNKYSLRLRRQLNPRDDGFLYHGKAEQLASLSPSPL